MAADALIFDLDGTVWDSWPWYASLIGRDDGQRREAVLSDLRNGHPIARLFREAGIKESHFRTLCRDDARCALYPGVRDTLARLTDEQVRLGAVTNLPDWVAGPMLDSLELRPLFGAYLHYGSSGQHKPHPAPLLRALEDLDVSAGPDAWYVGDTETDAKASRRAELSFAWVSYGYGDGGITADAVIDSFEQVAEL